MGAISGIAGGAVLSKVVEKVTGSSGGGGGGALQKPQQGL